MRESFPSSQPSPDPAEVAKKRAEWEGKKRSSTKPLPGELSEGHSASITSADDFQRRLAAREGARSIAEQLANSTKGNLIAPPYQELEEKRRESWNMLGALKYFFRTEVSRDEVERLMRVVGDGSSFVLSQLPYLRSSESERGAEDTLAGYQMRVEHMQHFLDSVRGAEEAGFRPTEKDIDELNALSKEIRTITQDVSARLGLRDQG